MTNTAMLAARYAGRPLLIERRALEQLVERIRAVDHRAFSRPSRIGALIRKLGTAIMPPETLAMDGEGAPAEPIETRLAYAPRYIGEPDDSGYCWSLSRGVALMRADTVLLEEGTEFCGTVFHGYDTLLYGMREAASDDRVKAIFLVMDSPGGVVSGGGITTLAKWMRENRGSAGGKPIHCYARMMCSAAYWVGAQTDRILAPAMGLVGSIGAYTVHEDWTGGMEKAGLVITEIKFGARKTDGAYWKALSKEARDDLQAEIDQVGRNFVADVAAGRPQLTEEKLLATEAAAYLPEHDEDKRSGKALGFVDEIMGEEPAFAALLAKISEAPALVTVGARAAGPGAATGKGPTMATTSNQGRHAARIAKLKAETARLEEEDKKDKPKEGEEGYEEEEDEAADTKNDNAAAIAASDEAKAEPAMALAAIQSGLTLAQFQAQVKALANRPKGGALREALKDAPRVGADVVQPQAGKATIDAADIYAQRRAAMGQRH